MSSRAGVGAPVRHRPGRLVIVPEEVVRVAARRPLVVAEDDTAYRAVLEEFMGAGWQVASGGTEPADGVVTVCTVTEPAAAGWAVLAATQGAVLVHAQVAREVVDDLLDDLARIAPVTLATAATVPVLDQDTWRLLHHLAGGTTVGAAAKILHMSTRTANRRLADARAALGAASRVELNRALGAPARIPVVSSR